MVSIPDSGCVRLTLFQNVFQVFCSGEENTRNKPDAMFVSTGNKHGVELAKGC